MTHLKDLLNKHIAATGPLGIDTFMQLALHHNPHGYYFRGTGIGRSGDFITAPEMSPLFGRCLANWINHQLGILKAKAWRLVECGPGRGTMLQTMLPFVKNQPNELHLVEASPSFQEQISNKISLPKLFVTDLGSLPESKLPTIVLGNEYLDALPVRQFQRQGEKIFEICVGLTNGKLSFVRKAAEEQPCPLPSDKDGWWEVSQTSVSHIEFLANEIKASGGAVMLIDYGYKEPNGKPSFQAIESHSRVDPLLNPGSADLTALVDFGRMSGVVSKAGLATHLETQKEFLIRFGLGNLLTKSPNEALAAARLVREDGMGNLFKVLSFFSPIPDKS